MKILFPTDLTEESFSAIKTILPKIISSDKPTEIVLFHVIDNTGYGSTSVRDLSQILMDDATAKLATEKKNIEVTHKIEVTSAVKVGHYDRELKWHVEKTNPDLVVLLSKAKHGVLKYVSGQKSVNFIGELTAPLLIIPIDFELDTISKMGLGIDKNESPTLETLYKIKKLAAYFESDVKMFHVSREVNETTDFYQHISTNMGFGEIEIVKDENILGGIQHWRDNNNIEVLITLTQPKGFFQRLRTGSVSRELVKENLTSLLIISQ